MYTSKPHKQIQSCTYVEETNDVEKDECLCSTCI